MQTVANTMHWQEIQTEINRRNVQLLQDYTRRFQRYTAASHHKAAFSKSQLSMLPVLATAIRSMERLCGSGSGSKNIQFLALGTDVVRMLDGGLIVCCKSAKDRTSMSVTLEQARLVVRHAQNRFGSNALALPLAFGQGTVKTDRGSVEAQQLGRGFLDLMRLVGVRRANVFKNTGKTSYAFNALQRSTLPPSLRPPAEACKESNVT